MNKANNAVYDETHELFRESFAAFVRAEMSPRIDEWESSSTATGN